MKILFGVTATLVLAVVLWLALGPKVEDRKASPGIFLFEPHAAGCAWYRVNLPSSEQDLLAVFHCDCNNVQWSFSEDRERALVWFDTETFGSGDAQLYEVEVKRQKPIRLPVPERGDAKLYAFGDDSKIEAFALEDEAGEAGDLSLAHAMTFTDGAWRVNETVTTRCCSDDAPGIRALPRVTKLLSPNASFTSLAVLSASPVPFTKVDQKLKPALSGTFGVHETLLVKVDSSYTLVADHRSGSRPFVFETASGRLVFSNKLAHGAYFWPKTRPGSIDRP